MQQDENHCHCENDGTANGVAEIHRTVEFEILHVAGKDRHHQAEYRAEQNDQKTVIEDLRRPHFKEASGWLPQQCEDEERTQSSQESQRDLGQKHEGPADRDEYAGCEHDDEAIHRIGDAVFSENARLLEGLLRLRESLFGRTVDERCRSSA